MQPHFCPFRPKHIKIRTFNDLFSTFLKDKWLKRYKPSKKLRPFGSEATFFASLLRESLHFGQPGLNPGLGTHRSKQMFSASFKGLINIYEEPENQGSSIIFGAFCEHSNYPHFIS